jgi:hypothetical protein
VIDEITVRTIIVVDNGSTNKKVTRYTYMNLGILVKFGFLNTQTDIILRNGCLAVIKYANVIEACDVTHYRFDIPVNCIILKISRGVEVYIGLLRNYQMPC